MKRALWLVLVASTLRAAEPTATTVWKVDRTDTIGELKVEVLGAPKVKDDAGVKSVVFDGEHDGLFLPLNPIADAKAFTVEILFAPAEGGPKEQRFVHIQDTVTNWRVMIETRLDGQGHWWLDTYLGRDRAGTPLIDPQKTHPTDQWYWAAVRFDGTTMTDFVNGEKEMEAPATFGVMGKGQTSLGVRQNKVAWFKGAIREVRFTPEALPAEKLQRVKASKDMKAEKTEPGEKTTTAPTTSTSAPATSAAGGSAKP